MSVQLPAESPLNPYTRAAELLGDLNVLRSSLMRNRGRRLARIHIDPLLLEVRTYGLHLQTLDIRQHARVHAAAIREISQTVGTKDPVILSNAKNPRISSEAPQTTEADL